MMPLFEQTKNRFSSILQKVGLVPLTGDQERLQALPSLPDGIGYCDLINSKQQLETAQQFHSLVSSLATTRKTALSSEIRLVSKEGGRKIIMLRMHCHDEEGEYTLKPHILSSHSGRDVPLSLQFLSEVLAYYVAVGLITPRERAQSIETINSRTDSDTLPGRTLRAPMVVDPNHPVLLPVAEDNVPHTYEDSFAEVHEMLTNGDTDMEPTAERSPIFDELLKEWSPEMMEVFGDYLVEQATASQHFTIDHAPTIKTNEVDAPALSRTDTTAQPLVTELASTRKKPELEPLPQNGTTPPAKRPRRPNPAHPETLQQSSHRKLEATTSFLKDLSPRTKLILVLGGVSIPITIGGAFFLVDTVIPTFVRAVEANPGPFAITAITFLSTIVIIGSHELGLKYPALRTVNRYGLIPATFVAMMHTGQHFGLLAQSPLLIGAGAVLTELVQYALSKLITRAGAYLPHKNVSQPES